MGEAACAWTASVFGGSRAARRLALIVIAALVLLGVPALARASVITQLPSGFPWAVNANDSVLYVNGRVWTNGTVLGPPQAPASDPTATFTPTAGDTENSESLLNNSGVVVGEVHTGGGAVVPGYWNSSVSSTFTEVSLSGLEVDGDPVTSGQFYGVDASGEAVGFVTDGTNYEGLYVPALGGVPAGAPQVVAAVGPEQPINQLDAISANYEEASGGSGEYLVNRQTLTATLTNFGAGIAPFADNGTMVGESTGPAPYLRLASGSETPLSYTGTALANGVNDAGSTVGADNGVGTIWNAAGTPTALQSLLPVNSGWSSLEPQSINAQGDVVGTGQIGGHGAVFLMTAVCGTSGVALNSVTYGAAHPNGARIGTPVTLVGKGFCPGMTIEFGNALAVVSPAASAISSDGTSVTVTVDRLATTGTLSVTSAGSTASLPQAQEPFAVDSFRDAEAFGFGNFSGTPSLSDFLYMFGASTMVPNVIDACPGGNCPVTVRSPTEATLDAYHAMAKSFGGGVCWAWDLLSQRLDAGETPLKTFSATASDTWELPESALMSALTTLQWADHSNQILALKDADLKPRTGAQVIGEVERAIAGGVEAGSNGAIISINLKEGNGWHGHALLAYDVQKVGLTWQIDVADPNHPYTTNEENPNGAAHIAAVDDSVITVDGNGTWTYLPLYGWNGSSTTIAVEPYSAIMSAIHSGLTAYAPGPGVLSTTIDPDTTLGALKDPAGQAVNISDPSAASGVDFTPETNPSAPGVYSFEGPSGTYVQTLSGASPGELIDTDALLADIDASSGTDTVSLDPQTATLTLNPSAGASASASAVTRATRASSRASHTATVSLVSTRTRKDQHTVTLTGPATGGVRLAFTHSDTGVAFSGGSGHYTLTLSDGRQATRVTLTLSRGEMVTLTPRWSALTGHAVLVHTRAHGHTRTERLGDRLRTPRTKITAITHSARSVTAGLTLPGLPTGSSVVLYLTVMNGKRKLAQQTTTLTPTTHASHRREHFTLRATPRRGSKIVIFAITQDNGSPPQLATSERTIQIR